jgi:hypothetical protein
MCSPSLVIAGISAATGIASAGVSYAGARRQAKAQAAYQAQAAAAALQKKAYQRTTAQIEAQQQKVAVAEEKGLVRKKTEADLSTARVAAGESGVSGVSVQHLMDDLRRQQAARLTGLTKQEERLELRRGLGLRQIELASQQELIGIRQPISKPSGLGAGLKMLQAGLGAFNMYQGMQAASRPPAIDTGAGISVYMPETDQYTNPFYTP